MKKTLIYLATVALLAGCRSRSETLKREQQQYDVVQEGQTSGVTSTINAPGEAPPSPAGMTGTNADTTSNFTTLPQTTMTTASMPQGTIAATLPVTSTDTPPPKPAPRPRPAPTPESTNIVPPTGDEHDSAEHRHGAASPALNGHAAAAGNDDDVVNVEDRRLACRDRQDCLSSIRMRGHVAGDVSGPHPEAAELLG